MGTFQDQSELERFKEYHMMPVPEGLQFLRMDQITNIVENELPNKRASVGAISLTPD